MDADPKFPLQELRSPAIHSPFYGRANKGGKNMPRGYTARCACGWQWRHSNDNKTKSKATSAYKAHLSEANDKTQATAAQKPQDKKL